MKKGIIERINEVWTEFKKQGAEPSFLYLGLEEADELASATYIGDKRTNKERKSEFMGLQVVEVKKSFWLKVGV